MVYSQRRVQSVLGEETNVILSDMAIIKNGPIECGISFFITRGAMIFWLRNFNHDKDVVITSSKVDAFTKKYCDRFRALLNENMVAIIKAYGAFPSVEFPAKNLAFVFESADRLASCESMTKNFEIIRIAINVDSMHLEDGQLYNFIKHELFHIIAKLKEGEDQVKLNVEKLQKNFSDQINREKKMLENGIRNIVEYCTGKRLSVGEIFEQLQVSMQYFYKYYAEKFWNLVDDSALCIIAMELEDRKFIFAWIQNDKSMVYSLGERLENLCNLREHIAKNEIDRKKKMFLLETLKIIQFIECFNGMPFFAIAYGILGEGWKERIKGSILRKLHINWHRNESSLNIYTFKALVKKYCDVEVEKRFMKFYDSYLNVIKAQAIRNDPLEPNIQKQIHDTGAIERSKEAYAILNQEFSELFDEIRAISV